VPHLLTYVHSNHLHFLPSTLLTCDYLHNTHLFTSGTKPVSMQQLIHSREFLGSVSIRSAQITVTHSVLWSQLPTKSQWDRALFLAIGIVLLIGELQMGWKYVINHVSNSENTCSHEQEICYWIPAISFQTLWTYKWERYSSSFKHLFLELASHTRSATREITAIEKSTTLHNMHNTWGYRHKTLKPATVTRITSQTLKLQSLGIEKANTAH
jgi:hypothetical protein